jgi:hypothetical protein
MGKRKSGRPKALSLYPITVQDAISAFIAVDPKKVEKRLEREKVKN